MKANINDPLGIKKVMGSITFVDYPNGSYTIFVENVHTTTVYSTHLMDAEDQSDFGYDVVHFLPNGKVKSIFTHNGLEFNYD
jgi:hypothetical protein